MCRALTLARQLSDLIASFPRTNPSTSSDGPDISALISAIRSRYRMLCATMGARARLVAASTTKRDADAVEGVEGPAKGVDLGQLRF